MSLSPRSAASADGPQRQHRIAILGATHSGLMMAAKLRGDGYNNIVIFDGGAPEPSDGLGPLIRFGVSIASASYRVDGSAWKLMATDGIIFDADIVVCAEDGLDDTEWHVAGLDGAKQYMRNERGSEVLFELGQVYEPPLEIVGRNGLSLSQAFSVGAVSHLGVTIPGFPNLFVLAGPNTRLTSNTMKFMVEAQVGLVVAIIAELDARSADEVEVSRAVASAAYTKVQKQFADGTNDVVWPGSTFSYVWQCKRFKSKDFCFGQR